jgi:predicted small lipoprotein YifL
MKNRLMHKLALVVLAACALALAGCGQEGDLSVPDLLAKAQQYNGKQVTVNGFYVGRGGDLSVLTPVVSTLDNGLDAQPSGDTVWLDGFPQATLETLHQPGDAIYGLVRVSGQFETAGGYGPEGKYPYQIRVASAESIERVKRVEQRVATAALGEGKVTLNDLVADPAKHNGQAVTTQGYYFWNGLIYVLAEGVSTEEDGSSPQPIGKQIWMEGFPPDESGKLHLGPNNSYVWGLVEVTGDFKSGGAFGKDGKYTEFLQATSAKALENVQK